MKKLINLNPSDLVKSGVIQVMEGRHCFEHLTVEENLLTGAYTERRKIKILEDLDMVYSYFPRLKQRRKAKQVILRVENSKCVLLVEL